MSPSVNADSASAGPPAVARWPAPTTNAHLPPTLRYTGLVLVAFVLSQYLAGFLLLSLLRADAREASPLTLARYAYYYGDRPQVSHRIWLCFGAGTALIGLTALPVWLPKRRSLHGDARFATLAEIRGAGLLAKQGVLLGKIGHRYLTMGGQQGVAL